MAPRIVVTSAVRRRRWPWVLVLLLLVVPTIEIAVIIWVGKSIGAWPTLLLLLAESALGAWLVKREGGRSWDALNTALSSGQMPSRQLADAALILVGGTLLLTPGFVTDFFGFFCILPFTRPLARSLLEAMVTRRLLGSAVRFAPGSASGAPPPASGDWRQEPGPSRSAASAEVIEGEIVD